MSMNTLSTRIEEKLAVFTPIGKECCMYKVHKLLRDVNEKAYKPMLLAIGLYHHDKVGQGFMEEHKWHYLQQMIIKTKGTVEAYIMALRELEKPARKCYVECISQTSDQFVEMMLLDGSFIIELFRKYEIYKKTGDHKYDPIFQMSWMYRTIARDLLLFENQLPFFVLAKLFNMSESNESRNLREVDVGKTNEISVDISPTQLNDLVLHFFSSTLPFKWNVDTSSYNSIEEKNLLGLTHEAPTPSLQKEMECQQFVIRFKKAEFEHLLGLIHTSICISLLDTEIDHVKECQEAEYTKIECLNIHSATELEEAIVKFKKAEIFKHLFGLIRKAVIPLLARMKNTRKTKLMEIEESNIHSATELEEAGVKFKKADKSNFFTMKFNNGLMEISPLSIHDDTETYLRNLIAYEQYCVQENGSNYVYNYVRFMDSLINSPKDVELLRRKGIISNHLGDDEIISTMVNKLGHYVGFATNILYARTSKNLNMHCKRRRNVWMAKLRRDYFNNPWALISFLAAVVLLALTLVQTIFSIIH